MMFLMFFFMFYFFWVIGLVIDVFVIVEIDDVFGCFEGVVCE